MISFNSDEGAPEPPDLEKLLQDYFSQSENNEIPEGVKKLLKVIFKGQFEEGSSHPDLHPLHIAKIIDYIFYTQEYQKLNLSIRKQSNTKLSLDINIKS